MKIKELLSELNKQDPEAKVWLGYDGNIVVTEAVCVETPRSEAEIGDCWWRFELGDVVILSKE